MKKSLFFFALLLQSCIAFAQHQLAGTVTDSIGIPYWPKCGIEYLALI